ncbi:MAG: serine hydrolase domain-containing protein [Saprospiraceae bacterium]
MKLISIVTLLTFAILSCNSNSKLNQNELRSEKANVISFSKNNAKKAGTTEPAFSKQFTLNEDEFLTAHFSLDQPLVQSLQQLDPSLSEEELLQKGNFQFSILVDDEVVYVENLNKGAGTLESKTKQLQHTVPLIAPQPLDFWGWFLWLKFMKMGGGQDKLSIGKHSLSIEVRPYLNNEKLQVGNLLAKGNIAFDVRDIPVDKSAIAIQEIKPNSGWNLSKAPFDKTKIEALNKKIAQKRFEDINGIVVIKEGELLLEEYFNGSERDALHDPRSVGKTFASTMMGIAIEENHIKNVDQELKEFYDLKSYENYSPAKDQVTLKSLLTMSSGFIGDDNDWSNPGNEENMYPTKNWVKFTLDLPMNQEKVMGKDYAYFTAGVVVLGDIIHKSVPSGLVSYADKKLFAPLGITNYEWQYTPQKVGNTAGGIRLRAVDFAKYGQLYKNKGKWNNKQIIPEQWVATSLSRQVKQINHGENAYYGYLFWNKIYTVDGKDYEVSFCTGNGGNKIFIFKDIPFVIVITSSAYGKPYAHPDADKIMTEYILPAVLADQ